MGLKLESYMKKSPQRMFPQMYVYSEEEEKGNYFQHHII